MKKNPKLGRAFYTVLSVLFAALFIVNVCNPHGTMLGAISTGGLALLMGGIAWRAWLGKRDTNEQKKT
ncbi:hypothetical protein A5745_16785 [Mycobacterium sp. IS-2888]|uniref:hypothetical protein n=1 Tax=Mycobacterium sp. IS-2888 TaxID=1834159 RepID=UPI00096CCC52|nr:hypothetical protein [Mycobacterium sp. IS-2888]OMC44192.1 hypothetical protein A5745_16785 [Mycobacterium sp. IS-2888]